MLWRCCGAAVAHRAEPAVVGVPALHNLALLTEAEEGERPPRIFVRPSDAQRTAVTIRSEEASGKRARLIAREKINCLWAEAKNNVR